METNLLLKNNTVTSGLNKSRLQHGDYSENIGYFT